MELIGEIRSLRAEMNIEPKKNLSVKLVVKNLEDAILIEQNISKLLSLARLSTVDFSEAISGNLLRGVAKLGEFGLDIQGAIDIRAERDRLQKELARVTIEIDKILKKINSHEFISRAPQEIVLEIRSRHEELVERYKKIESNLSHLQPT
jgi:valyl-tRNA synthetase